MVEPRSGLATQCGDDVGHGVLVGPVEGGLAAAHLRNEVPGGEDPRGVDGHADALEVEGRVHGAVVTVVAVVGGHGDGVGEDEVGVVVGVGGVGELAGVGVGLDLR